MSPSIIGIQDPQNIAYALLGLAFIVFWIFLFIILYHLTRFGIGTIPKRLGIIFLTGSIIMFCTTVVFFLTVDVHSLMGQFVSLIKSTNSFK